MTSYKQVTSCEHAVLSEATSSVQDQWRPHTGEQVQLEHAPQLSCQHLPPRCLSSVHTRMYKQLASCLIYARALLEYVIIIMWLRSVIKMLRSVKFTEDKVLTFLILCEKC